MPSWEHFSHDADVGIRGIGNTVEQAFEMAAIALTAVVTIPEKVSSSITFHIHCEDSDMELLFYDWLNALIYEMDTKKILFNKYKVHISNGVLDAECSGERVNSVSHDPAVDIKGATMTELKVIHVKDQWIAQCIVDV
ncbi:MAG: archease [Bacteriovorax sp.]|nr:archease [Bacteriovorax sp.]